MANHSKERLKRQEEVEQIAAADGMAAALLALIQASADNKIRIPIADMERAYATPFTLQVAPEGDQLVISAVFTETVH